MEVDLDFLLQKSKHFCIYPWTHLSLFSNGKTLPCCRANPKLSLGKLQGDDLSSIWNSPEMRQLRIDLLEDKPSNFCEGCYLEEQHGMRSLRNLANGEFDHHGPQITTTESNGYYPLNLKFLDIKFDNVCNFKCRTCNPDFSTSWYEDAKSLGLFTPQNKRSTPTDNPKMFIEKLSPQLKGLEKIYFAGGEPLLMEGHYLLLEKLIELGNTNLSLVYNTNLSTFKFKHWNALSLWKNFSNISLEVSLDGIEARGEYIRSGLCWDTFLENVNLVQSINPHIKMGIWATASILNSYAILDLIKWSLENVLKSPNDFGINILRDPEIYSLTTLPIEQKRIVEKRFNCFIKEYLLKHYDFSLVKKLVYELKKLNDYMFGSDTSSSIPSLINITRKLDQIRGESVSSVLQELDFLSQHQTESP